MAQPPSAGLSFGHGGRPLCHGVQPVKSSVLALERPTEPAVAAGLRGGQNLVGDSAGPSPVGP